MTPAGTCSPSPNLDWLYESEPVTWRRVPTEPFPAGNPAAYLRWLAPHRTGMGADRRTTRRSRPARRRHAQPLPARDRAHRIRPARRAACSAAATCTASGHAKPTLTSTSTATSPTTARPGVSARAETCTGDAGTSETGGVQDAPLTRRPTPTPSTRTPPRPPPTRPRPLTSPPVIATHRTTTTHAPLTRYLTGISCARRTGRERTQASHHYSPCSASRVLDTRSLETRVVIVGTKTRQHSHEQHTQPTCERCTHTLRTCILDARANGQVDDFTRGFDHLHRQVRPGQVRATATVLVDFQFGNNVISGL